MSEPVSGDGSPKAAGARKRLPRAFDAVFAQGLASELELHPDDSPIRIKRVPPHQRPQVTTLLGDLDGLVVDARADGVGGPAPEPKARPITTGPVRDPISGTADEG